MIVILAIAFGAVLGWRRAGARGGDRLDRLQYAAAHAIAFGVATFVAIVAIGQIGS